MPISLGQAASEHKGPEAASARAVPEKLQAPCACSASLEARMSEVLAIEKQVEKVPSEAGTSAVPSHCAHW